MRPEIIQFIAIIMFLGGCTATQPMASVVVQSDAPVAIPETQPLTLNPVQWQVMTLPQLQKLVAAIQAQPQHQPIIFALDTNNYNNLTLNLIEIQRYIEEQKAVLTMLKNIIAARSASRTPAIPSSPTVRAVTRR